MKLLYIGVGLAFALASDLVFCASIDHYFRPYVVIEGSQTDLIEIHADQQIFTTLYSSQKKAFKSLNIPFDIVSTSGKDVGYRLSLIESTHTCDGQDYNVDVTLNGSEWPEDGLQFSGSSDKYQMTLTFARLEQSKVATKKCFGTLRVQVENVVI
ncbi:hypothetical protein [Vibrio sp. AND4]|uniref:hypothetical protein n=1 Tax=Vibrio sp. AND4 TaxID=314289 RepID=UPI00015F2FFC|nr:hypothetical protein [Vibrio sp. AND4]EDP60463.1 hypothetical protein AND4_06084 [Vibrio sp. AND4]